MFAPGSIAVPLSEKGRLTRRLDTIAPANGFNHDKAHDALADVEATIYMAKLVRTRTPNLWDAMMATANKNAAIDVLEENHALALVECYYGRHNITPVTWCGQNPEYTAQVGLFCQTVERMPRFGIERDAPPDAALVVLHYPTFLARFLAGTASAAAR